MMVLGDDGPAAVASAASTSVSASIGLTERVDNARLDAVDRELIGCTQAFVQREPRTDQRDGFRWIPLPSARHDGRCVRALAPPPRSGCRYASTGHPTI